MGPSLVRGWSRPPESWGISEELTSVLSLTPRKHILDTVPEALPHADPLLDRELLSNFLSLGFVQSNFRRKNSPGKHRRDLVPHPCPGSALQLLAISWQTYLGNSEGDQKVFCFCGGLAYVLACVRACVGACVGTKTRKRY